MHDNDNKRGLTEWEEAQWRQIRTGLGDFPKQREVFIERLARRPILSAVGAASILTAGMLGLMTSLNKSQPERFSPAEQAVLRDAGHLERLGLCTPILEEAARDNQAAGEHLKAYQLQRAASVAEAAGVSCISATSVVVVKIADTQHLVGSANLVGIGNLSVIEATPSPTPTPAPSPS